MEGYGERKRLLKMRRRSAKKFLAVKGIEGAKKDAHSSYTVQTAVEVAVELAADKLDFTTLKASEAVKSNKVLVGQEAAEMLVEYASKTESVARYLQSNPEMWTELVNG